MENIKKYLTLTNRICITISLLFLAFYMIFGPVLAISLHESTIQRIEQTTQIDDLRWECNELISHINFAIGNARTFSILFIVFILMVIGVCYINIAILNNLIKSKEIQEKKN